MDTIINTFTPAKQGVIRRSKIQGSTKVVAEAEADRHLSNAAHLFLILLFVVLLVLYSVLALVWHFTRPDEEVFMQLPSSELPSISLRISTKCSNPPYCGAVTISSNYTDTSAFASTDSATACVGYTETVFDQADTASTPAVTVPLCYVADTVINPMLRTALPISGVQVNFAGINPGEDKSTTPHTSNSSMAAAGEVLIEATDGSFSRLISMDTWQVKTLLVEQSMGKKEGSAIQSSSRPLAIQYEGGRPNWRSTLIIQQTAFSNVYETSRPGSIINVLASVGGAFYIILALMTLLSVGLGLCCPGPVAIKEQEEQRQQAEEEGQKKKKMKKEEDHQEAPQSPSVGGASPHV